MIYIKYSFWEDIKSFLTTIHNIMWLNKNRYIYDLNPFNLPHKLSIHEFIRVLTDKLNTLDIPSSYKIFVVHFGTYGTYYPPDKIVLSLHQTPERAVQTCLHEIAHLMIEPQVIRHKLSHDEKELLAEQQEHQLMAKL